MGGHLRRIVSSRGASSAPAESTKERAEEKDILAVGSEGESKGVDESV